MKGLENERIKEGRKKGLENERIEELKKEE